MASTQVVNRSSLTRFAWLSVAVAVLTIGLKSAAYFITGSVGLMSDALESLVNLAGALMALVMLTIAARPADENHAFGHGKAEYFSSGVEGTLILVAAISIAYTAIERLFNPQPLESIGVGLIVSVIASLANLGVSITIKNAGKRYNSVSLISNAGHLMTDVWTSGGVLVGVALVAITRWQPLDSIVAILVAANIVWTGFGIVRGAVLGLMDTAIPAEEQTIVRQVLDERKNIGARYHDLRTRQAGAARVISFHLLVPAGWTVERGHKLASEVEAEIEKRLPESMVFTHLEPSNEMPALEVPTEEK